MSKIDLPIAVSSRTFSRHAELRKRCETVFSNVKFNDEGKTLKGQELVGFLKGAQGVIVALEPMTNEVLEQLPDLKVISKYGVGLDNLSLTAMTKRGIKLGWSGGVNARSVSELALGFTLSISRNIFVTSRKMSSGLWENSGGFQLTGKTVGIVGCGFVGRDFIRLLQPFKCRILINDILSMWDFCKESDCEQVDLQMLLKESDVVSLHVPYDQTTDNLMNEERLGLMKDGAILINTSRGSIVDESALCAALSGGKLLGAGMDVFAAEPPGECDLLKLPNFFGTPHIGGSSREAILDMGLAAISNLKAQLALL